MATMSDAFLFNSFIPATAFILMFVVFPTWLYWGGRQARKQRSREQIRRQGTPPR